MKAEDVGQRDLYLRHYGSPDHPLHDGKGISWETRFQGIWADLAAQPAAGWIIGEDLPRELHLPMRGIR